MLGRGVGGGDNTLPYEPSDDPSGGPVRQLATFVRHHKTERSNHLISGTNGIEIPSI